MNRDLLHATVKIHLSQYKPGQSDKWINRVVESVAELPNFQHDYQIDSIHSHMLTQMRIWGCGIAERYYPGGTARLPEDLAQDAFVNWCIYYRPERGASEETFYFKCVQSACGKAYKLDTMLLYKELEVNDFDVFLDEKGNEVYKEVRSAFLPFKEYEPSESEDELVEEEMEIRRREEDTIYANDKDGFLINEEAEVVRQPESSVFRISQIKKALYDSIGTGLSDTATDEKADLITQIGSDQTDRTDLVELQKPHILIRHLFLKGVAAQGSDIFPIIREKGFGRGSFYSGQKDALGRPSLYYYNRLSIFKSFSERLHMERCLANLRRSDAAFEDSIRKGAYHNNIRTAIPVISTLVADSDNRLVECFYTFGNRILFPKGIMCGLGNEAFLYQFALKRSSEVPDKIVYTTHIPGYRPVLKSLDKSHVVAGMDDLLVPPVVTMLESGVSQVYFGNSNISSPSGMVSQSMLRSGCYTINISDGKLVSDKVSKVEQARDIAAQGLLEDYFIARGYRVEHEDKSRRIYKINSGIKTNLFPRDISAEIRELNLAYLKEVFPEEFY